MNPLAALLSLISSDMPSISTDDGDFSSNAHTPLADSGLFDRRETEDEVPSNSTDLSFKDGNLAVISGHQYFLVHQSVLCRHSVVLKEMIESSTSNETTTYIEDRPLLRLPHRPEETLALLKYLYGLIHHNDWENFDVLSILLRLATTYKLETLRARVLRQLSLQWPTTLRQWELREKHILQPDGTYAPRSDLPHPILVFKLAQEVDAPELLPSACYDLSRYLPSQLAAGYLERRTGVVHKLSVDDLFRLYRGKEQAARYFSTFIVKELESRKPSPVCHNRNEVQPSRKRRCQMAFEAVTYALIRDVNGFVLKRNNDPLFAISDSLLMQTREDAPGLENTATTRACEACRLDFAAVIETVRGEFWSRLPDWFDCPVPGW